jgi:hypothetical protein
MDSRPRHGSDRSGTARPTRCHPTPAFPAFPRHSSDARHRAIRTHKLQSPAEGEPNGKCIWSSRAFEERTEKSTAGSPTVYSRTRGFGKLKLERAPYIVSRCSQADKPRVEEAVGKDPKGIAASGENNCVGSCEAHHVGSSTDEDCGGTAGKVGEVQGGEEESCLEPTQPITRIVLHSYSSEEYRQLCCLWSMPSVKACAPVHSFEEPTFPASKGRPVRPPR